MARQPVTARLRRVLAVALALPFVLLNLLAPQVMPGRSGDGTTTLTLCTGAGPVAVTIDRRTGKPVPDHAPDGDRCAWAAAHGIAALPDFTTVAAPVPVTAVAPVGLAPTATRQRLHGAAHLPRGPPVPV